MSRSLRMRNRLPSLYRDDMGDLLSAYLASVGGVLDDLDRDAGAVMRSHWMRQAERAAYSDHFNLTRTYAARGPLGPRGRIDILQMDQWLRQLQEAQTPLTVFLAEQLPQELFDRLGQNGAERDLTLHGQMLAFLEGLLDGALLYTAERFAGITLPTEVQNQVDGPPLPPAERAALNLGLLLAAFPQILGRAHLDQRHFNDLARLGALVPLQPWLQPFGLRESAETYRLRLGRMVSLYREGLGTLPALRRAVQASLPVDPTQPPPQRDQAFTVEPFPAVNTQAMAVAVRGQNPHLVGPLMRWSVTNSGLRSAIPTVYIQGLTPQEGVFDACQAPLIERLSSQEGDHALGLAYEDTVAPQMTLRLQPGYASWIGRVSGPQRHRSLPGDSQPADPTAPGPWNAVSGSPETNVNAIYQTYDGVLWVAGSGVDDEELWRFDGRQWTLALSGSEPTHDLTQLGDALLIATDNGLLRMPLYPEDGVSFEAVPVPEMADRHVFALLRQDNSVWLGTDLGLFSFDGATASPFGPNQAHGSATPVYAIYRDDTNLLYLGCDLGLFRHHPRSRAWYWYAGEHHGEQEPDWQAFEVDENGHPNQLPDAAQVFLPPVRSLYRGQDTWLWIGTDHGLARYGAAPVRGTTYQTLLQGFPELIGESVTQIRSDESGGIWFCSGRGLFRYDGRDMWQSRSTGWHQLGAANLVYQGNPQPRGAWRYARGASEWQRYVVGGWAVQALDVRTTLGDRISTICWTDILVADRGSFDGQQFVRESGVADSKFRMRIKPQPDRILDGGIAALPRLTTGETTWRYLRYVPEPAPPPPPEKRPAWNPEGLLWAPPTRPDAPWPGRYDLSNPPPESVFDEAVFAHLPAARVWFAWDDARPLLVVVRLVRRGQQSVDPAILDRVWEAIHLVKPAGVRVLLAVGQQIVRGENNGN